MLEKSDDDSDLILWKFSGRVHLKGKENVKSFRSIFVENKKKKSIDLTLLRRG